MIRCEKQINKINPMWMLVWTCQSWPFQVSIIIFPPYSHNLHFLPLSFPFILHNSFSITISTKPLLWVDLEPCTWWNLIKTKKKRKEIEYCYLLSLTKVHKTFTNYWSPGKYSLSDVSMKNIEFITIMIYHEDSVKAG